MRIPARTSGRPSKSVAWLRTENAHAAWRRGARRRQARRRMRAPGGCPAPRPPDGRRAGRRSARRATACIASIGRECTAAGGVTPDSRITPGARTPDAPANRTTGSSQSRRTQWKKWTDGSGSWWCSAACSSARLSPTGRWATTAAQAARRALPAPRRDSVPRRSGRLRCRAGAVRDQEQTLKVPPPKLPAAAMRRTRNPTHRRHEPRGAINLAARSRGR